MYLKDSVLTLGYKIIVLNGLCNGSSCQEINRSQVLGITSSQMVLGCKFDHTFILNSDLENLAAKFPQHIDS